VWHEARIPLFPLGADSLTTQESWALNASGIHVNKIEGILGGPSTTWSRFFWPTALIFLSPRLNCLRLKGSLPSGFFTRIANSINHFSRSAPSDIWCPTVREVELIETGEQSPRMTLNTLSDLLGALPNTRSLLVERISLPEPIDRLRFLSVKELHLEGSNNAKTGLGRILQAFPNLRILSTAPRYQPPPPSPLISNLFRRIGPRSPLIDFGRNLVSLDVAWGDEDRPQRSKQSLEKTAFLHRLTELPNLKYLSIPLNALYRSGTRMQYTDITRFLPQSLEVLWIREHWGKDQNNQRHEPGDDEGLSIFHEGLLGETGYTAKICAMLKDLVSGRMRSLFRIEFVYAKDGRLDDLPRFLDRNGEAFARSGFTTSVGLRGGGEGPGWWYWGTRLWTATRADSENRTWPGFRERLWHPFHLVCWACTDELRMPKYCSDPARRKELARRRKEGQ
jgi:hypothetical protein